MKVDNLSAVKKEFFKITRILPLHKTNFLSSSIRRGDYLFPHLATRIFDYPKLLNILTKKIKIWLQLSKSEFTYCLAGYIYYLKHDFKQAELFFFKAIGENPDNLDNWLDLAFSLYHQNKEKHELAKFIFFNFDLFIKYYKKQSNKICNLKVIKTMAQKITTSTPAINAPPVLVKPPAK